eukprot:gene18867-25423_t
MQETMKRALVKAESLKAADALLNAHLLNEPQVTSLVSQAAHPAAHATRAPKPAAGAGVQPALMYTDTQLNCCDQGIWGSVLRATSQTPPVTQAKPTLLVRSQAPPVAQAKPIPLVSQAPPVAQAKPAPLVSQAPPAAQAKPTSTAWLAAGAWIKQAVMTMEETDTHLNLCDQGIWGPVLYKPLPREEIQAPPTDPATCPAMPLELVVWGLPVSQHLPCPAKPAADASAQPAVMDQEEGHVDELIVWGVPFLTLSISIIALCIEADSSALKRLICSQTLDASKASQFEHAIKHAYWYELFLEYLPVWGFVGEMRHDSVGDVAYIYTHKTFDLSYNGDKIIQVNLTSDNPVAVVDGAQLQFTYSVNWVPSTIPFARRFDRYLDYNFFEHKIHWFSIFNSFIMVIFLTGLVAIILMRTLRKDYARYAKTEDDLESLERDLSEESGWKLVYGDVFRPPQQLTLLAACVGTGIQLALLCLFVIFFTIAGSFFEERGTILTAFIVCYALTSFVGGYVSGGFYARNDGRNWIRTMLATACLFPGVCFGIALLLNTIALCYHSLAAVPFGYIMLVICLWGFISFPLCLIGTVFGRNWYKPVLETVLSTGNCIVNWNLLETEPEHCHSSQVHYFIFKTKMSGFFQTCFYFGYTLMGCLGLTLM